MTCGTEQGHSDRPEEEGRPDGMSCPRSDSLDPAHALLVRDDSPHVRRNRLWVEAVLRKTPVPLHEPGLTVSRDMLLDPLDFQRQAVTRRSTRPGCGRGC